MAQRNRAEARDHEYHGLGGWLLLFYVLTILGVVCGLWMILAGGQPDQTMAGMPAQSPTNLILSIVFYLPFLILTSMKHAAMPRIAIWAAWTYTFVNAIVTGVEGNSAEAGIIPLVFSAVCAALFTWYLTRSKRVNVTFRHRVRES